MISLGRASPANFGLRYKAGLLASGRRFRARRHDPTGLSPSVAIGDFPVRLVPWRRTATLDLVTTPRTTTHADSTSDSILFVRHY